MNTLIANEHIADAKDCIVEAIRSIKRVQKNFPESGQAIDTVIQKLNSASEDLTAVLPLIA